VWGDSLLATCTATPVGVTGSATFSNGKLAHSFAADGNPNDGLSGRLNDTEAIPDTPPVNFTLSGVITNVGDVFTAVFNQQIVHPDGSLTVNAMHMYLFGPTAVGEMVRGSATCGTTPSLLTSTDTLAPNCGTPVVEPVSPDDPTPKTPRTELVGVFDAGTGSPPTGLTSISNIQATNATVDVGNPDPGYPPYTHFTPGQTGPLPITATRIDQSLPMHWSFDAIDAVGNSTHCQGVPESPPVAGADTYSATEDTPLTVAAPGVLANDTDVDANPLTADSATSPVHGTVGLNSDGSFTYTPVANYNGTDTFTYVVRDGAGGSATGTVTINIAAVNDAPVAAGDNYSATTAIPLTVAPPGVLANDTDVDGNSLSAAKVSDPANGTVTVNGDGSLTYTSSAGFSGTDSFTYKANDGALDSNVATVNITVTAVNDAPTCANTTLTA
ncbi:MAG: tandem-95 repeat protein, partial [Actinobacteria bacterium]|nr:tandem-95 repeat protein [Actinomycetota bacterium]